MCNNDNQLDMTKKCVGIVESYKIWDTYLENFVNFFFFFQDNNEGINVNCYIFNQMLICDCDRGFELKNSNSTNFQICEGKLYIFFYL